MTSFQASSLIFSASSTTMVHGHIRNSTSAAIRVPKFSRTSFSSAPRTIARDLVEELQLRDGFAKTMLPIHKYLTDYKNEETTDSETITTSTTTRKLYVVLEAVADRIEMHKNVGEQRNNWNTLLLNSINMITLTASTMAGVMAAASSCESSGSNSLLALKLASTLLFSAATGMSIIMNKIQPSQLAEEQRNATRLFKELYNEIQTKLTLFNEPTELDVKDAMKKVLSLDKAYPLPLLGSKMIEKFPAKFEPAKWWPNNSSKHKFQGKNRSKDMNKNGWSREIEEEMKEVRKVLKTKDSEDYMRLGDLALKVNKILAISGPLLTGIAAAGSAFASNGQPLVATVAATLGALAAIVNTLEHGGQVGMVVEMYRNCAGFFNNMDESIDSILEEDEIERREDGEIFEMKVALKLGRSLSELRDLAKRSSSSGKEGNAVHEFASKLF